MGRSYLCDYAHVMFLCEIQSNESRPNISFTFGKMFSFKDDSINEKVFEFIQILELCRVGFPVSLSVRSILFVNKCLPFTMAVEIVPTALTLLMFLSEADAGGCLILVRDTSTNIHRGSPTPFVIHLTCHTNDFACFCVTKVCYFSIR